MPHMRGSGYSSEDFMKLSRTGPATSLTMNDQGLSTIIGTNKDSTGKTLPSKTRYEFNRLQHGSEKQIKKDLPV